MPACHTVTSWAGSLRGVPPSGLLAGLVPPSGTLSNGDLSKLIGQPFLNNGCVGRLTFCQEGKLSHLNWILEALARKDRQQSQTCVLSADVFEVCLQAAKGFRSFLDGQ